MSKYSGKCDIYDCFFRYSNEELRRTKFFINNEQILIRNQKELAPFYPFLIGVHCASKDGGVVHMSSCSYVDEHETSVLKFYLEELKKARNTLKRKKEEITVEALMAKVSWNTHSYIRVLAERVYEDAWRATIEGIVMDGIVPIYRDLLCKDLIAMGYSEMAARDWVYNKGNHHNHANIHKALDIGAKAGDKIIELLTHNDLDAMGCIIIAKLAFGDKVDYVTCSNGSIDEAVTKHLMADAIYDETHITDISVSRELAQRIQETRANYFLLDHHRTALHLNDFDWCDVRVALSSDGPDVSERRTCGTELYYYWLIKKGYLCRTEALDEFVQAVRAYDVWEWKELGEVGKVSEALNILLSEYGEQQFIDMFYTILQQGPLYFSSADKAVIEAYHRREARVIEQKEKEMQRVIFQEKTIGVVFADDYVNAIGNTLCLRHPEVDCVAIVNCGQNSVSFRATKEDMDVSAIASSFGGGGHKLAAGAPLSETAPVDILQAIFGKDCAVWVKS